jgi:hypothetical protein
MKWPRWLKRSRDGVSEEAAAWRREWAAAIEAPDAAALERLRQSLTAVAAAMASRDGQPAAADLETEEEMLDAFGRLVDLHASIAGGALPRVETTHRVVGTDVCHFTAPASMPDETAQPSGRLLLTGTRALFVGGPRLVALPWHAAAEILRTDRDVLIVKHDRTDLLRFRCNTYGDALAAAILARHLMGARRRTL